MRNNFFGPYWPTPNNAVAINCGSEIHAGPNAVPCYSVSQPVREHVRGCGSR